MAKTFFVYRTKHDSVKICDCTGEELYRTVRQVGERPPCPNGLRDADSYPLCVHCGLIDNRPYGVKGHPLSQCDTCFGFFKGPRIYFPKDHTCPKCEAKL